MLFKKRAGILTLIFISVFLFAIFSFSKTAFSNPVVINGDSPPEALAGALAWRY